MYTTCILYIKISIKICIHILFRIQITSLFTAQVIRHFNDFVFKGVHAGYIYVTKL